MRLVSLDLRHFRNYSSLHLDLGAGVNILFGRNAAGKTNVLEGIFFLATSRSHRTHQDQDLITWGEDDLAVGALLDSGYGQIHAEIRYQRDKRRQIRLGGSQVRVVDLLGRVPVVFFGPDDLQMLKGSPALRRRYLDLFLSQTHPPYFKALQSYVHVVTQRNGLLRQLREGGGTAGTLEVWDDQFIEYATTVTHYRLQALGPVQARAAESQQQLSEGREKLTLTYEFAAGGEPQDPAAIRDRLQTALAERRREELSRAQTTVGPHRDDLLIRINGVDARSFGSQGQQRSAVLSLKLAELGYLRQEAGTNPLLLLDDVTSELDDGRRGLLLEAVGREAQTFITCTTLDDLDPRWLESSHLHRVEAGEIRPYGR
ncbi:MAG: DNA replication/repair protein RecF [Symbiobacteriia bacterium]